MEEVSLNDLEQNSVPLRPQSLYPEISIASMEEHAPGAYQTNPTGTESISQSKGVLTVLEENTRRPSYQSTRASSAVCVLAADVDDDKQELNAKNRRIIIIITLAAAIICSVGVVLGILFGRGGNDNTNPEQPSTVVSLSPTRAPTEPSPTKTEDEALTSCQMGDIGDDIASSGKFQTIWQIIKKNPNHGDVLPNIDTPGTSARRAICFMAKFDSFLLSTGSDIDTISDEFQYVVIQRYVLAFLYFYFGEEIGNQRFLDLRKDHLWLSNSASCDWGGEGTGESRVNCVGLETWASQLNFAELELEGTLPLEITLLTRLERIEFPNNRLTGTIPQEFFQNMPSLVGFNVQSNRLNGTIPSEIASRPFTKLHVGENQLTGTIPVQLSQLSDSMSSLNLSNLRFLQGQYFPTEIESLTNLKVLDLANNQLRGSIPDFVYDGFHNLESLDLSSNLLHGSINAEIGLLTDLEALSFADNRIRGVIPTEIGLLTNMKYLNLENNRLTGSIPSEIGNLKQVVFVKLDRQSRLTGAVPREICSIGKQILIPPCGMECDCCFDCSYEVVAP